LNILTQEKIFSSHNANVSRVISSWHYGGRQQWWCRIDAFVNSDVSEVRGIEIANHLKANATELLRQQLK
jgi:hypothetical protein